MTRDEILNMPAGEEIDALIAEHVFGDKKPTQALDANHVMLSMIGVTHPYTSAGGSWTGVAYWEEGDIPRWVAKNYSTDIAAAWEVVDKLYGITLVRHKVFWHCIFDKSTEGERDEDYMQGDTVPLAICRAALLAVML